MSKAMTLIKLFVLVFLLVPYISTEKMSQDLSAQFSANSARFSLDLYNVLSNDNEGKNLIFSPFSIQTCVGLAFAGATDDTASEIATGLKLIANDRALVGASFKQVLDNYANSSLLKIANKVYVMDGYKIKAEFNQIAKESFLSSAEEINFGASAAAANTINKWVETKTNDKIKDLISPDSLDALTRLVLVNAIHFKGEWANKFRKESTAEEDFFINEVDSVKVQMMNGKAKYKYGYFEDLDCSALEMPYRDSDLSMLVLLPNSRTGLKDLEQKLKGVNLLDLSNNMRQEEVIVKFPKFKVEFSTELTKTLQKLGIKKMFSDAAELGNFLDSPEPLKVSKVIHKAFIEVNEEGAEAAAATAVRIVQKCGFWGSAPKQISFYVNKPFLYLIRMQNNAHLFAGKIGNFEKQNV